MSIYKRSDSSFKLLSKVHGLIYVLNERLTKKIPQDVKLRKYINQSLGWFDGSMEDLGDELKLNFSIDKVPFQIFLRKDSSDANVFIQCILNREYDIVASMAKSLPDRPVRIVDGGANIGVAAIHFNCALGKQCEIVCIEPLDSNADHLQKILDTNEYANVQVIRKGLWNKMAHLKPAKEHKPGLEWGFTLVETDNPTESVIEVTTIKDIMSAKGWTGIDVLKLDIEGAEAVIFNDDDCLKSFLPATKIITIEVHADFISREAVISKLKAFGFVTFETGEHVVGVNTNSSEN